MTCHNWCQALAGLESDLAAACKLEYKKNVNCDCIVVISERTPVLTQYRLTQPFNKD